MSDGQELRQELANIDPCTRELIAQLIESECPHEPDEHPEGCCELCDFVFAITADLRDDDPGEPAEIDADRYPDLLNDARSNR